MKSIKKTVATLIKHTRYNQGVLYLSLDGNKAVIYVRLPYTIYRKEIILNNNLPKIRIAVNWKDIKEVFEDIHNIRFEGNNLYIGNIEIPYFEEDCSALEELFTKDYKKILNLPPGFVSNILYLKNYTATEDTRPSLNGILFDRENGNLRLVATDGHILGMFGTEVPFDHEPFILPKEVLDVLKYICDKEFKLYSEGKWLKINDCLVFEPTGVFPDYRQVIPEKFYGLVKLAVTKETIKELKKLQKVNNGELEIEFKKEYSWLEEQELYTAPKQKNRRRPNTKKYIEYLKGLLPQEVVRKMVKCNNCGYEVILGDGYCPVCFEKN